MEPGGPMPRSQRPSHNPYPEPNQTLFLLLIPISLRIILILSFRLRLGLPKGLFPAGVPVKILKALLPSFHSGYMTRPSQSSRLNHAEYTR